jgi:hypothetical protein
VLYMSIKTYRSIFQNRSMENGPFKSLSQLMIAILKGEKSVKVEMI